MAQYVYIFFEPAVDPKQNKVFYVGKGTGNRPKGHLSESGVSSAMRVSNASDVPPNEKGARTENLLDSELQKEQSPGGAPNLDKVQRIQRLVHERRLGPKDMIRVIAQGLDDSMAETLEAFAIHFVFGKSNLTNRAPGKHHERFRSYGDWSPQFGQSVNKDKPFYVYVLRNPKTNDVLYVGKGTGDRKFAHFKEGEALNEDEKTRKHLALQTLQDQGYVPENIAFVIASNLTAEEAFAIESFALKYVYGHTMAANTNIVRGHKSFHFRAKDDWDLRLGFDLPFLAASSKQKAREMERDLMLGEAMDVPLLAVIGSFRQLEWGEPRIVDAGELAYEAPVQVADGTQGGRIKVFIRGKGGIQVEFRAGTKAKKWLLDFFSRLNYTNRRDDVQLVYFPDVWVDKPTPDLKEATERVRIVLSLLNSNSKEDLVQKVGDGGVAVQKNCLD